MERSTRYADPGRPAQESPAEPEAHPSEPTRGSTAHPAHRAASGHAPATHVGKALRRMVALCERFGQDALAAEAREALVPVEEGLLRMVALGQFKRGKSTLLNALLGAPILPTGMAPVTSVATVMRWAPVPELTVHYADGEVAAAAPERLADYVVEARNPGNALGVRLVQVGYPAALLEDGLVLVDTPGIGSPDRRATERAYDFLPSVDAGLVVLSPDPPVGEAEAAYVQQLGSLTPHLLFVLNKVDQVSEPEWREVLDFDRQVLADALGRDPDRIDVVPVSARRALEDDDPSVGLLGDRIEAFVQAKGEHARDGLARRRLEGVAANLRALLDVERHGLDLEVGDLEARIEGLRTTLATLERRTERAVRAVMAAVSEIVGGAGDELLERARAGVGALTATLEKTVRGASSVESNGALAARFDDALADGTWRLLDAWWAEREATLVGVLLEEMDHATDELADARRDAAAWIHDAFGVALPEEPRVEAMRDSPSFYHHVEGLTPHLTVDLLRALLPRVLYRRWVANAASRLAQQALEMGAGQVRGDLLYRARETARGFTAELRAWTVAGVQGLVDGVDRAAALRTETTAAADARRMTLDEALAELGEIMSGLRRHRPPGAVRPRTRSTDSGRT